MKKIIGFFKWLFNGECEHRWISIGREKVLQHGDCPRYVTFHNVRCVKCNEHKKVRCL